MGPRKRKSNDLEEDKPEKKPRKPSEENKSIDRSQSKKVERGENSKYFKNKKMDSSESSTSGLFVKRITVDLPLEVDNVKKSMKDSKAKKAGAGKKITEYVAHEKMDSTEPSTSGLNVKELIVDKTIDVDIVKKLIKDRENQKARAAKRIAKLPPIDFDKSSNENSKNMLNMGSSNNVSTKGNKKKKANTSISSKEIEFSKFPNVTKYILERQVYGNEYKSAREVQNFCISRKLLDFKLLDRNSFVESRITTLTWNQNRPHQVAFSDKHGHIVVGDLKQSENSINWKLLLQKNGVGPGGNILAMKFAKSKRPDHYSLWSVGLEGIVVGFECSYSEEILAPNPSDLTELNYRAFLPTNNYNHWYPSMDLNHDETLLAAGCTKGFVQLMTLEGERVENFKASKGKLSHVEFCPKNPMLLVTASLDKTVKIWDRRYLKTINDFIANLPHNKAVSSAYFNDKSDTLLTTDQCDEIRTYDTSTWQVLSTIKHPHRQFRHLTPIKATWHPSADIIVAGRYPIAKHEHRCVNVMSAAGSSICSLDSTSSLIQTVVRFSPDGKFLLSSFGMGIEVWGTRSSSLQRIPTL